MKRKILVALAFLLFSYAFASQQTSNSGTTPGYTTHIGPFPTGGGSPVGPDDPSNQPGDVDSEDSDSDSDSGTDSGTHADGTPCPWWHIFC